MQNLYSSWYELNLHCCYHHLLQKTAFPLSSLITTSNLKEDIAFMPSAH